MSNNSAITPTSVVHVDGLERAQAKGLTHVTCIIHRPKRVYMRRRDKNNAAVLTFDNSTKALSLPQTTCHPPDIARILGNVAIHSSRALRHWTYYPAPSLGSLRVRECTDVNHELRQYREGHLVGGSTITKHQENIKTLYLKGINHVRAVVSPEFVQVQYGGRHADG